MTSSMTFFYQWTKLLTMLELAALWFVTIEGIESYDIVTTYIATGGAIVISLASFLYLNSENSKRGAASTSTSTTKTMTTIVIHFVLLFGILVVYHFAKESGMTVANEVSRLLFGGSNKTQVSSKKRGAFGLFGNGKKKTMAMTMSLSSYIMDSTNWNMDKIILPALCIEATLMVFAAAIAFALTYTSNQTSTTTTVKAEKNATSAVTKETTTSTTSSVVKEAIVDTKDMTTVGIKEAELISASNPEVILPPALSKHVDPAPVEEPNYEPASTPPLHARKVEESVVIKDPPKLPPAPGTDTSNGACYLVYEPDSSGRLVEYYSKTPVQGAVGMWVPGDGYSLPGFKFTPANSRTVVIGNCSAGVIGRKNYSSGWCSYVRSAQLMNGWVTLWDPSSTKGLAVDVYTYQDGETVQLNVGQPVNVGGALAVACLPKNSRFHGGIHGIPMNKWMEDGRAKGASSMIKKANYTPSRSTMGSVGARTSVGSTTASPTNHRVFGSRNENTPSSRRITFNTPAKKQESAARTPLQKSVMASTLSKERVRHRASAGPVECLDAHATASNENASSPSEGDSDAARLIQMMMSKGYSIQQVETELDRQTQGNIPTEIAQELQRVKAL